MCIGLSDVFFQLMPCQRVVPKGSTEVRFWKVTLLGTPALILCVLSLLESCDGG